MKNKSRIKRWLLESSLILLIGLAVLVSYAWADPPSCWQHCSGRAVVVSVVTTTCNCTCYACVTISEYDDGCCTGYSGPDCNCSDNEKPCCMASSTCKTANCL